LRRIVEKIEKQKNDSSFNIKKIHKLSFFYKRVFIVVSKGAGFDGTPSLILKNCASAFERPCSLLFNRSLSTCVFPDMWKLSYVTPLFKKGRRNNVEDYRGVALLCAIPKHFELLVY
jgi:hypothetical protein